MPRHSLALALVITLCLPPLAARAEAPATGPQATTQTAQGAGWRGRYEAARRRLLQRDLAGAAVGFDRLALETEDPIERALAFEMAKLARWAHDPAAAKASAARRPKADGWWAALESAELSMLDDDLLRASTRFDQLAMMTDSRLGRALAFELGKLTRLVHQHERVLTTKPRPPRRPARTTFELGTLYVAAALDGAYTLTLLGALAGPSSKVPTVWLKLGPPVGMFAGLGAIALYDSAPVPRRGVPASMVAGFEIASADMILGVIIIGESGANSVEGTGLMMPIALSLPTAGLIVGGFIGDAHVKTPATPVWVSSGALWGGAMAGLVAAAATDDVGSIAEAAFYGVNAGVGLAALTASWVAPSQTRVRLLDLGGLSGGLLALGAHQTLKGRDATETQPYGYMAVGTAAGLGLAWALTSGMARDRGEPEGDGATSPVTNVRASLLPMPSGVGVGVSGVLF